MTNKMAKKAMGLKGFMNSMSKPKMKKGGFPDLNKDGEITKADILMGRGVINKPKAQMGMKTSPSYKYLKGTGWNYFKTPTAKDSSDYRTGYQTALNKKELKQSSNPSGATIRGYNEGFEKTKKKGQMGMNIKKETLKNATPSIPNSYYKMGGMKEENPLSGMLKESMKEKAMAKKKAMANNAKGKSMPKGKGKKKMQAGGRFMPGLPVATATEGKDFVNKQSFKKGGMIKKKK